MLFRIPYVTGFCIFVRTKCVWYLVQSVKNLYIKTNKQTKKLDFALWKSQNTVRNWQIPNMGRVTKLCCVEYNLIWQAIATQKLQAPKGNKLQATQVNSKFCQWHLPTLKSFLLLTNFTPKADCTQRMT
jgi:hypothetical protein